MALHPYDLYDVRSLLSEEERAVQDTVARFTDERVLPIIGQCFDEGRFPTELIPEIAGLGLLGATLPAEYGGSELNYVSYGLICQELERGDSGLRSFASVQSSRVVAYNVTYRNPDGTTGTMRTDSKPGNRIALGTQDKTVGYDVTYRYEGVERTVRMDRDPGDHLPVIDGQVVIQTAAADAPAKRG